MSQNVALIGIGMMGTAIGTRLLETGHALSVYNRSPEKALALGELGAVVTGSPAEAAESADFIILSLNSAEIVREVMFGEHGVVSKATDNALVIDMSSIDPESTKAIATQALEHGLRWLDCPLSGGAPKALLGTLTVMAGGTTDAFEHSKLVMNDLCANYTLMGPTGAGQTTKLINQVLCALHFVAVAEATQLAQDAGVDAAKIPEALKGGRADSAILQEFMGKMAAKDYSPMGRIDNMVKDLNGVQDLARLTNTAMPLTATCAEIHRLLTAAGLGSADNAALMEYYQGPKPT